LPSSSEYILFRGQHCYITINEQPYVSKGFHLLVIPYEHKKYPHMLTKEVCDEMNILTHSCIKKLSSHSNEIQITSNIGTDATASIPEHLHQHIICTSSERYNNIIDAIRHTSQGINILPFSLIESLEKKSAIIVQFYAAERIREILLSIAVNMQQSYLTIPLSQ
jgi:diadenosine tetraphosphate (Ap4A) HIT family hydrolase